MIGLFASLRVHPHVVGATGLRVRNGVSVDFVLPWPAVARVDARYRSLPSSRAVQLEAADDGIVLHISAGSQTSVDVVLREPLAVSLPKGPSGAVTEVRLYADDPHALVARARRQLTVGLTRPESHAGPWRPGPATTPGPSGTTTVAGATYPTAVSVSGPARATAYVSGGGLWPRRLLALAVAAVVFTAAAGVLLGGPELDVHDLQFPVWLATGLRLAEGHWWPRRSARLVWRPRVAGRYAVESGLVARRSLAGWAVQMTELAWATPVAVALISLLPDGPGSARDARAVLLVGVAAGLGRVAYGEARFTGRLALTASGVRHRDRQYAWSNIDRARLAVVDGRVDGVRLRLIVRKALEPAPVVGGRGVAVSDERLLAAIDHFRARPEALAVGLPVTAPEPAGAPAGG
ncbi:hypothetical protein OG799_25285 [Micromonospora sp. NBC_00898]|uniref:hypothetical protein n=1 Tax=Micromonospora sp. NBC_00898 TaxID=2975981 RepID=UPI00386607CF|nr:hypothetical protein OG799_25285 [Micromonospora sp. NBC_00898]